MPLRDKTLPAHPFSPHVRYKTLPAHPPSPHVRYKTLPARPKWLNLALFLHAGRVLYRSDHQEAEQGEFCTECEVEIERADTTAHQAPPAWSGRHPRSRRTRPRCGLRPVGRTSTGSQGHRQTNFACNSIGPNFNKPRKRCNSNDANSIFEQAAGELHAKLLWRGQQRGLATAETASRGPLHPLRATAPVTGRDTRSEGVHCLQIGCSTASHKNKRGTCETQAWLRHPWAAAGPGRASRRRAERSSRRGRLAGGPPPTGAPSSPARQHIQNRPPGTGWAYLSRLWESNPRPIHYE